MHYSIYVTQYLLQAVAGVTFNDDRYYTLLFYDDHSQAWIRFGGGGGGHIEGGWLAMAIKMNEGGYWLATPPLNLHVYNA